MRGMLFVIGSFAITILCWGMYGPVLHWGQDGMSVSPPPLARFLPFVCVGLAYFAVGVIAPVVWLLARGESGHWTTRGTLLSLGAGALGAVGALGIILAFTFGGSPSYVMPLVFGGAPVVNAFITIYLAGRMKEIGPIFLAGLFMVVLGAVVVLATKPKDPHIQQHVEAAESAEDRADADKNVLQEAVDESRSFALQVVSIATVIVCWGAYGPTLHKGQSAMGNSRMRPLLCVGVAYFLIAVLGGESILLVWDGLQEVERWTFGGAFWSLMAGAAGAVGALGIILAFNFGGKPVYVMPLVFGGAPVVNTFFTIIARGRLGDVKAFFLAGLIVLISGAVLVLVFAPRGAPPARRDAAATKPAPAPEVNS